MINRILHYAAVFCITFVVALLCLNILCGCGGEESCLGPAGSFKGSAMLSIYNCQGGVPVNPPTMLLEIESDSPLRACGWHEIHASTAVRPDGHVVETRKDLNTKADGYRGIIIAEISYPGNPRKCMAVWEIDFVEAL